jgi:tight adherence protein B
MVTNLEVIAYVGMFLTCGGTTAAVLLAMNWHNSPLHRAWLDHTAALDKELRFLFSNLRGHKLATYEVLAVAVALVAAALLESREFLAVALVAAAAPLFYLRRERAKKVAEIEKGLDGWLMGLANALTACPSLGEAIARSARNIRSPLQGELDLMLKKVQLGTPLDRALRQMSKRVGSSTLASAVITIEVARQSGGNLPKTLSETAASLREIARLETVVKAKTAEGKMQAYVLSGIPFVLVIAIHAVDPNWLIPMTETPLGMLMVAVALALWAAAMLMIRRILAVNI